MAANRTEHRPRSNFDDDKTRHLYDQIAWFSEEDGPSLLQGLAYDQQAGSFDFIPQVFPGLSRSEVSWRIPRHYPLWCVFPGGPGFSCLFRSMATATPASDQVLRL